jgi:surface antigen
LVLLSTLALTGTAAATITLAGQAGPAQALAPQATQAPAVEAEVMHAPTVVQVAPSPKAAPVRRAAVRKPARPTAAATRAAAPRRTVTVRRATAAPKPAATTAAKPVTTTRTGNDYPYASATTNTPDPWGFTKRQCVSFAAFRLAQHGHALNNGTQGWGSALHWDETARSLGVRISSTPRVGAVAQWNAGEASKVYVNGSSTPNGTFSAGSYGHVGWVAAVYSDGSALIEQYNLGGDRSYSVMRMKAPRYLVF